MKVSALSRLPYLAKNFSRFTARAARPLAGRRARHSMHQAVLETLEPRVLLAAAITYYNTPTDVPTGWTTSVYAQGRIGKIGSATFEGDIGQNSASPVQALNFPTGQDWGQGVAKNFTFTVDGEGKAVFELDGATRMNGTGQTTIEYTGNFRGNDLRMYVKAPIGAYAVELTDLTLTNSEGITLKSNFSLSTANTSGNYRAAWVSDASLISGFTLTGKATFNWAGTRPQNSQLHFQILTGKWSVPQLDSFTATSNAVPANSVTTTSSSTIPTLFVEEGLDSSTATWRNAVIDLSGTITPTTANRGLVLWKAVGIDEADGSASPRQGTLAGPTQITLAPDSTRTFTITGGADANRDGVLQNEEATRTLQVVVVRIDELTVRDARTFDPGTTVTSTLTSSVAAARNKDGIVSLGISTVVQPGIAAAAQAFSYAISKGSGEIVRAGQLDVNEQTIDLTVDASTDVLYVDAGFDADGDGLEAHEVRRSIRVNVLRLDSATARDYGAPTRNSTAESSTVPTLRLGTTMGGFARLGGRVVTSPIPTGSEGRVRWALEQGGAIVEQDRFYSWGMQYDVDPGLGRTATLHTGIDLDDDGTLTPDEYSRSINIELVSVNSLEVEAESESIGAATVFSITDKNLWLKLASDRAILANITAGFVNATFGANGTGQDVRFTIKTENGTLLAQNSFADSASANQIPFTLPTGQKTAIVRLGFDDSADHILQDGEASRTITINSGLIDVDIDSDNDNGTQAPRRTVAEEAVEETSAKNVRDGYHDADQDLIPDYADGFNHDGAVGDDDFSALHHEFSKLVIEIPGYIDRNAADIRITYGNAADPNSARITRTGAGTVNNPFRYSVAATDELRIWTKDARWARNAASLSAGGDYVAPGTYRLSNLYNIVGETELVLYVEGVRPGAAQAIRVEIDPDVVAGNGFVDEDSVSAQVIDPSPKTRTDWKDDAYADAGMLPGWNAAFGFNAINRTNMSNVYDYYEKLYLRGVAEKGGKLLWVGVARRAAGPVLGGMYDLITTQAELKAIQADPAYAPAYTALGAAVGVAGTIALGGIGTVTGAFISSIPALLDAVIDMNFRIEQEFCGGSKAIFDDMAWPHIAYLNIGLDALDAVFFRDADPRLSAQAYSGWQKIDSGVSPTAAVVEEGNTDLGFYEQRTVLQPYMDRIHAILGVNLGPTPTLLTFAGITATLSISPGSMFGALSSNPVPGGSSFWSSQGILADLTNRDLRWNWIATDIFPLFYAKSMATKDSLVRETNISLLTPFASMFSGSPQLDALLAAVDPLFVAH